jgi:Domain of unknown function (DU1801)
MTGVILRQRFSVRPNLLYRPQKKGYVNFGFFFGAGLSDPKKLLIGESKRLRHVKIWSAEEAQKPALAKLIAATWEQALKSVAKVHVGRKNSKA